MNMRLISGSCHPDFADKISENLGVNLTPVDIHKFANGEIYIRIMEKVRGEDVYLIQSVGAPVNESLMETLIMIDALKRASAGRINLICPFLAYTRQDRKVKSREPISAKLVANMLTVAGVDRLVTVDLHAEQIQGFFDIPVDHFVGYPLFAKYLKQKKYKNLTIVAPDIGGVKRANKVSDLLGTPLVIIDKIRKAHNQAEIACVVGEVKWKTAVIVDDSIDTGGSIVAAVEEIKKMGAEKIIVAATHPILSGDAVSRLNKCAADEVLLTDTLPVKIRKNNKKIKIISIAPLMAKVIRRIHENESLGELFTWEDKQVVL